MNFSRIGCVTYLNARPLVPENPSGIRFDHPSVLSKALADGELDAALVPVYEWFRHPEYLATDGVAIACHGEVYSVFLTSRKPVEVLEKVWLDPASRSSNHLVRVLLQCHPHIQYGFREEAPSRIADHEGALLIGDRAIHFHQQFGDAFLYHDLGEWWLRETGLPFVFALWLIRPDTENAKQLAAQFRLLAKDIPHRIEAIASRHTLPDFVRHYFTANVHHHLGGEEKRGIEEYGRRLFSCGLIPRYVASRRYL